MKIKLLINKGKSKYQQYQNRCKYPQYPCNFYLMLWIAGFIVGSLLFILASFLFIFKLILYPKLQRKLPSFIKPTGVSKCKFYCIIDDFAFFNSIQLFYFYT